MIIGIHGRINSGKDYAGKYLQKKYPDKEWKIVRFGDVLKQVAALILDVDPKMFEDRNFKKKILPKCWDYYVISIVMFGKTTKVDKNFSLREALRYKEDFMKTYNKADVKINIYKHNMTVRKFLQLLATEGFREQVHPYLWINALFNKYNFQPILVNREADYKEVNWIITDLRFPEEADKIRGYDGYLLKVIDPTDKSIPVHSSETALSDYEYFNHTIFNHKNDQFHNDLDDFYKKFII